MDDLGVLIVKEQGAWRLGKEGTRIQIPESRGRLGTGDDGMARKGSAGDIRGG